MIYLKENCEVVHISHRVSPQENKSETRIYFDIYVKINNYFWKLKINEPHKCSELKFVDINNISESEKDLFSYDLEIIKMVKNWENFSEIN